MDLLPEGEPPSVSRAGGSWARWSEWSTSASASASTAHQPLQTAQPNGRRSGSGLAGDAAVRCMDGQGGRDPAAVAQAAAGEGEEEQAGEDGRERARARTRQRFAIRTPLGAGGGSGPLVSFVLAQTSRCFYLVGSTSDGGRARMMTIDRTSQAAGQRQPLEVQLDPPEYTRFLETRPSTKAMADEYLSALERSDSKSFQRMEIRGLLGALRFTEGYYLVVIKEAARVGHLGCHELFRVEEMDLVQVGYEVAGWSMMPRIGSWTSAETKNKQKLLGAHLEKDFYFSHTYDLTHSLQFNVCGIGASASQARQWEPQSMFLWNHFLLSGLYDVAPGSKTDSEKQAGGDDGSQGFEFVQAEMALAVVCGFVSQKQLSLVGRTISLTLIARRSRHFAGTRYRKRGINNRGHVANDVETEQIVHHDANRVHPIGQHYTSFVQVRGSAPVYWSQETGLAVQPKIECNIIDPAHHATMLHFSDLMMRYGCPIVCLNLVKEGRDRNGLLQSSAARRLDGEADDVHREVKLANEYAEAFEHLNKSLPRIRGTPLLEYTHRDLRRIKAEAAIDEAQKEQDPMTASMESMLQGAEVTLPGLEDLSVQVEKLGFFNSEDVSFDNERHSTAAPVRRQLQRGVVRSNCVDSLDRTNTAQFHLGLYALGHQLHALHVLPEKNGSTIGKSRLDLSDSDDKEITIVLAQLYEDMGNTIALQYGGSEAHQFMLAKLEGRSEFLGSVGDAYKSVRRYYANSISDQEKQGAINLFLGKFEHQFELMHRAEQVATRVDVWELGSDWQLHNREEDWPLPCQTGQHNDFFSGDLKWWEIALSRYDERVLALESGSKVDLPTTEPEPESAPESEPSCANGETELSEGRRHSGLLPTHVFAQQYGLCRCDKRAAAACNCPDILSSFGGAGGDPGTVSNGLMDEFGAKMAFIKEPYVTSEAKEIIDQEIEAEVLKASLIMRGFDGTTAPQMSWMSERPPPLPPGSTGDGATHRHADSVIALRRTSSLGRAAMHRDSIKSIATKHKLRREWIKEYVARTEMQGLSPASRHHLLMEDNGEQSTDHGNEVDQGQSQQPTALEAANEHTAFRFMGFAAAEAAAETAVQEQQLDRLRISKQTQDPTLLQPNSPSDNKAIYEDYVPCRQQRDAITAHLLHQMYPLTQDEASHGSSLAEAQAKADEKEAAEVKLNQMTLGELRDLARQTDGLDSVTVETAMLSEELGDPLAELPLATAAANAATRAEEDGSGVLPGWRNSDSWQLGRHTRTPELCGDEDESQYGKARLQEQLRRRLLEKLGRPFGRRPAPLFEPGSVQAPPAAGGSKQTVPFSRPQGQGVGASLAHGHQSKSVVQIANASHVARDLQSCLDITCGGSEWNDARRENDVDKLLDARILEMLLGCRGQGAVDGGISETAKMSSHRIYELLVDSVAMDALVKQLRTSLSGSLSEDALLEEYVYPSESERSHNERISGDMTVDSGSQAKAAQPEEANGLTAPVEKLPLPKATGADSEQDEQDEETGAMRGITHKTRRPTSSSSLSADASINAQLADDAFQIGGVYDSLLCRVGGVSKAYHRLMAPGYGHYHAEYNRQRKEDEPEIVEDYRDDAFLTGALPSPHVSAAQAAAAAEGLKLLIDLQLGDDAFDTTEAGTTEG